MINVQKNESNSIVLYHSPLDISSSLSTPNSTRKPLNMCLTALIASAIQESRRDKFSKAQGGGDIHPYPLQNNSFRNEYAPKYGYALSAPLPNGFQDRQLSR